MKNFQPVDKLRPTSILPGIFCETCGQRTGASAERVRCRKEGEVRRKGGETERGMGKTVEWDKSEERAAC